MPMTGEQSTNGSSAKSSPRVAIAIPTPSSTMQQPAKKSPVAVNTTSEGETKEDDPRRLAGATRSLCENWTNLFPQGFDGKSDEHLKTLDGLCWTYCHRERWQHVFNEFWRSHPISLRNAVISLTKEHNESLLRRVTPRQELSPARGSSEVAVTSPVVATNDHVSGPVAGTKRKRGDNDNDSNDDDMLVVSPSQDEQKLLDEFSTWNSKLTEFLRQKNQQYVQQLSARDSRIQALERKLGRKDHEIVQKNDQLILKNVEIIQKDNELVQKNNELTQKDEEAAALCATIDSQKKASSALNEEMLKSDSEHSHTVLKLEEEKSQVELKLKTSTNEAIRYIEEVRDLKRGRDRHASELRRLQGSLDVRTKTVDRLQEDLDAVRKEKEKTQKQLTAANAEKDRMKMEAEAAKRSATQLKKEKTDAEEKYGDLQRRANDAEARLKAVKDLLDPRRSHADDDRGTGECGRADKGRKRR